MDEIKDNLDIVIREHDRSGAVKAFDKVFSYLLY